MSTPKELKTADFDLHLLPIFRHVTHEAKVPFAPVEFFENWRSYMSLGLARTWASKSSVLGAFFVKDLFGNRLRATVMFFFALPEVRGTQITKNLFLAFEEAAREAGCVDVQTSAHEGIEPIHRAEAYVKNGFRKTETVYTKPLYG